MKKKQVIILTLFLAILIAGLVYNYTFNSKHRNIVNEEATITLSANELHSYFLNNESLATTNYLDKVIAVSGKITSVETNNVALSDKIQVSFISEGVLKYKEQESISIKG
ncbi:hypothetical protein [Lacinutrix sp. Hel_I_90]|uniref:OB-fold protein n=1 Tax=Lacinutrix sp. Hel_I_90 TaxID=1249999 RepID=UPI0005CA031B|nr:hypothetical protein [Lacinutrix sp. Hel_I_90]